MGKQKTHTFGPDGKTWDRRVSKMSVSFFDRDAELMDWLCEYLGCGRSEVVRTAVRMLAGQLAQVPRRSGANTASNASINVTGVDEEGNRGPTEPPSARP